MLLANAGVDAALDVAAINEDETKRALKLAGASVEDAALRLATLKAERVSRRQPGALVLGCDQMLECEGRWFDKPASPAEAALQLAALSGRTHRLVSAVVAVEDGVLAWRHLDEARMTMRALSPCFIDAYVASLGEAATGSVGAYQLEGRGAQLFARIEGDFFTILGLPLLPVLAFLRARGALFA